MYLLPSDNTVASYWITNPDNTYVDNVAAGSRRTDSGCHWESTRTAPSEGSDDSLNTWPRRTNFREFRGNTAHSAYDGFMFDRNINSDNTFGVPGSSPWSAVENPADPEQQGAGLCIRGSDHLQEPQWRHLGPGQLHCSGM